MQIAQRKLEHLKICLNQPVEVGSTGFEDYRFVHSALPEIDFGKIDTSVKFLGKKLKAPSDWGISTAESIAQCRRVKGLKVIGSGGIRNGIEMAKAIALGADLVGLALPFLKPATQSTEAVEMKLTRLIQELKIAMFCVGAKNIDKLKSAQLISMTQKRP